MMDSLIKITDRTEMLLPLERSDVDRIVIGFREYCLNKYDDISPKGFEKEKIDERIGLQKKPSDQHQELRDSMLQYFGYNIKTYKPIDCIVELLRNPRILKRSLAHTWTAWQKLHGEIYFDDLLVVHTIRVAAPKVFELLATNIRTFRLFVGPKTKHSNKNLCERIALVLKEQHGEEIVLYHQLITFLFPGWKMAKDGDTEEPDNKMAEYVDRAFGGTPHPQGIAISEPADYFYRLTSEDVSGDDQNTMRDIITYNKGSVSEEVLMNKMIEDAKYAARIEHFGLLLTPDKVLHLTSAYFKTVFEYDYRRFADFELTGQLWRIHLKSPTSVKIHHAWLKDMLSTYLPLSLRFAGDIFYFWKFRKDSKAESRYAPSEIEQMYTNLIKTHFENEPEKLIKALSKPKHIWTLRHLLFKMKENIAIKQYGEKATFFSAWQPWFIDLLIRAAEVNPKLIAMYIIPLLYDLKMTDIDTDADLEGDEPMFSHAWKAHFDEEIARLVFGERFSDAMTVVSNLSESNYADYELSEQERCILDFAVVHSKKWKESQSSNQISEQE